MRDLVHESRLKKFRHEKLLQNINYKYIYTISLIDTVVVYVYKYL